ncbi:MAG: alpha/beta hydrolase [Balneolaceae bacterium]|nr:alpha/beta hydrolase [Balneolaceae bacterium]
MFGLLARGDCFVVLHSKPTLSFIVFYTTIDIPDEISGLMLLSGAYRTRPGARTSPSFFQKIRILASSLFRPTHQVVEYYREGMVGLDDPLFNFRYTLRFFRMLDMDDLTLPPDLNMPVLVGVGDRDELFEIDAARELYDDIPGQRKEFIVLEGAAHAKFPIESWTELVKWLDNMSSDKN